jgi:choline dehydrogenase-like flavoprotein
MGTEQVLRYPELGQHWRADVCVIGGGVAGLTSAYLLAREGRSVAVLERGHIGGGETARTTAHLSNALDDGFPALETLFQESGARLAQESHAAAIDRIESICAIEGWTASSPAGWLPVPATWRDGSCVGTGDGCRPTRRSHEVEWLIRAPLAGLGLEPVFDFPVRRN